MTGAMGLAIAGAAIAVALAFGTWRKFTDGRFREQPVAVPGPPWHGYTLGERATLIQFSSAFCAPCRTTRVILEDVAANVPGVVHHDIDAESELALIRELGIMRTPTTLILNSDGVEIARATGAPRREQVLASLP